MMTTKQEALDHVRRPIPEMVVEHPHWRSEGGANPKLAYESSERRSRLWIVRREDGTQSALISSELGAELEAAGAKPYPENRLRWRR